MTMASMNPGMAAQDATKVLCGRSVFNMIPVTAYRFAPQTEPAQRHNAMAKRIPRFTSPSRSPTHLFYRRRSIPLGAPQTVLGPHQLRVALGVLLDFYN